MKSILTGIFYLAIVSASLSSADATDGDQGLAWLAPDLLCRFSVDGLAVLPQPDTVYLQGDSRNCPRSYGDVALLSSQCIPNRVIFSKELNSPAVVFEAVSTNLRGDFIVRLRNVATGELSTHLVVVPGSYASSDSGQASARTARLEFGAPYIGLLVDGRRYGASCYVQYFEHH